ncbi:hypothetical protein OMB55_00003490 [gamma proteobacterium HIMB55]|nr:hypothetical protein OMB55_00003490 [gamma proteobacterium HIMB55]
MISLPTITANARGSECSPKQIDASERTGAGSKAVTRTGVTNGMASVAIAMGLIMSVIPNGSIAEVGKHHEVNLAKAVRLSTSEILKTFSDTLDRGAVQSKRGISAETRWLSSGGFESRWWRETGEGPKINVVSGRWKAENNERCVLFQDAPVGEWQCTPVFRRADGAIISLNGDGSVHGVHQISPLELSAEDPH